MLETGKRWVKEWKDEGISASLVSMPTMKPFDTESVKKFIHREIPIISLEEHNIIGGLGSAIAEVIADTGIGVKFLRLGINDMFSHFVGSHDYQKQKSNLTEKPKLQWFNSKQN